MSNDRSREIVTAPSLGLSVASRLAERTLTARAARSALTDREAVPSVLTSAPGRTLIVGSDEPGAYFTIGEAVEEARDGDRILVRPGTYDESITVNRSIDIVGDGDRGAIVVQFDEAPCFVLAGASSLIANFTVRGGGDTDDHMAGGAVVVARGSPVLEGLLLDQSFGIDVGGAASPTVRRCVLRNGLFMAISLHDGATGTIEDNEIFGNTDNGIWVDGVGTAPVIRRNNIHDGLSTGIWIQSGAAGTIEDNEIHANAEFGIMIAEAGKSLVIRRNSIHNGQDAGIYVWGEAGGTIEDNEIFGNSDAGIRVEQAGTAPVIRRNIIHNGLSAGILIQSGAAGTIEDNEIYGNAIAGIEMRGVGTAPTIRGNRIRECRDVGLNVHGGATGTIEINEIFNNAADGVFVWGVGTAPTIHGNRIHDNAGSGISVIAGAAGSITDNVITDNGEDAISTTEGATPTMSGNVTS